MLTILCLFIWMENFNSSPNTISRLSTFHVFSGYIQDGVELILWDLPEIIGKDSFTSLKLAIVVNNLIKMQINEKRNC